MRDYLTWGQQRLAEFQKALARHGRRNAVRIRVQDIPIFNSYLTPEGDRNPHKSYGYLRTPELSAHIRDSL